MTERGAGNLNLRLKSLPGNGRCAVDLQATKFSEWRKYGPG
jgi:hypothetical protein